jgi:2-polyprenyl-3-methyl-5-hydroxy-6-metoxy-1,4-benzoquinol methylase
MLNPSTQQKYSIQDGMTGKELRRVLREALETRGSMMSPDDLDETGLRSYVEGFGMSRYVFWRKLDIVIDLATLSESVRVLDFGCGSGILLPYLAGKNRQVFAVDLRLDLASYVSSRLDLPNVHLLGQEWTTSIPDQSLDLIVAANVLEHVEERFPLLRLFACKLKSGGRLVVSGPSENALYRLGRAMVGFSGHYHKANIYDVISDVVTAGFQEERVRTWPFRGLACLYCVASFVAPLPSKSQPILPDQGP